MPVSRRDGFHGPCSQRTVPFRRYAYTFRQFKAAELGLWYASTNYTSSKPALNIVTDIIGWITVFAWQANVASVGYLTASQIQTLIVLNNESYIYERWHGTMIF